ncbi:hypothetical protein BVH03_00515 [Pseudomonas sp. PA15(2017)]|nr:hypothetical protein BVH03_00515 [Pseudomonas sp. PA15(2017)]
MHIGPTFIGAQPLAQDEFSGLNLRLVNSPTGSFPHFFFQLSSDELFDIRYGDDYERSIDTSEKEYLEKINNLVSSLKRELEAAQASAEPQSTDNLSRAIISHEASINQKIADLAAQQSQANSFYQSDFSSKSRSDFTERMTELVMQQGIAAESAMAMWHASREAAYDARYLTEEINSLNHQVENLRTQLDTGQAEIEPTLTTPHDDLPVDHSGGNSTGFHWAQGAMSSEVIIAITRQSETLHQHKSHPHSPHYIAPGSDNYIAAGAMNFFVPTAAALPGLIADMTRTTLSQAEYTAIKNVALKNTIIAQVALAGSAVSNDIDQGISPYVAMGTQAAMLAMGAGVAVAAGALGIPAVLAAGLLFSIGLEWYGAQGKINSFLSKTLGLTPNIVDGEPEPQVLTGYQVYQALMQIQQTPQAYPIAEQMISEFVTEARTSLLQNERFSIEAQVDQAISSAAPTVVTMAEQSLLADGYHEFIATGKEAYLFNSAGAEYSRMTGGDGLNWFLIQEDWQLDGWDHTTPQNIVTGGAGYNVLDFSAVQQDVHVFLERNDYLDQRLQALKRESMSPAFLDETIIRNKPGREFQELDTAADYYSSGIYKNIDLVIGSSHDDFLVGHWLGGHTMTGGYGYDTFVLHGGSNTIKFYDNDFAMPGGEVIIKFVHGFTLQMEANHFNNYHYIPGLGFRSQFGPDKLDFSAMDANLNIEGKQAFDYIANQAFSGSAGELRLDMSAADKSTYTLQGDRTGSGIADFEIEFHALPFTEIFWEFMKLEENLIL